MKIIDSGKFWIIEYEGDLYRRVDQGQNYSTMWIDLKSKIVYQHFDDKFKELENEYIRLTLIEAKG